MAFMYDYLLQAYNAQYSSNSFYLPLRSILDIDESISSEFKPITNVRTFSSAFNDAEQRARTGTSKWTASIEMRKLTAQEGLEWEQFFARIQGGGRFMLYDPQQKSINKPSIADTGITFDDGTGFSDGTDFVGSIYEATTYSQSSTRYLTVQMSPNPSTTQTFFTAGQKITIQTQNSDGLVGYELKVLTEDCIVSSSTGRGFLQFEPPLRSNAKIGGGVFFIRPFGIFTLADPTSYTLGADFNNLYDISFEAMEST